MLLEGAGYVGEQVGGDLLLEGVDEEDEEDSVRGMLASEIFSGAAIALRGFSDDVLASHDTRLLICRRYSKEQSIRGLLQSKCSALPAFIFQP